MTLPLKTVTTGSLAGYPVFDQFQWARFVQYVGGAINKGVNYDMGGKDPKLGAWPIDYTGIDCSGFVRTTLFFATSGQSGSVGMPDGSYNECDWFLAEKFKAHHVQEEADYLVNASVLDNRIRVCVHIPNGRGGDTTGHIWFLSRDFHGGTTVVSSESYGGNGPGHRAWNHPWFVGHCDYIFVIAEA